MTFAWETPCVLGVDQVCDAAVGTLFMESEQGGWWALGRTARLLPPGP